MKSAISALLVSTALAIPAHATSPPDEEARIQACLSRAADRFGVDLVALQVIREIEGGRLGTESLNANGTYDLGPMQINTFWLPAIERSGASYQLLRDDPCVNAFVAAWIFSQEVRSAGTTVGAMARYHSPTPHFQARYLDRALTIVRQQIAEEGAAPADDR